MARSGGSETILSRKVRLKTTLFLRIASVLTIIHAVLHTIGGVLSKPNNGAPEIAIIDAMKSRAFNVMGSMRTYWDFFFAYGILVSIALLVQGILFWQLATLAKTDAVRLKPILVLFTLNFLVTTVIAWRYFFFAPAVTELLIAAFLGAAYFAASPKATA
jgi:phosphoglycerol transferase MdoB-like AlkP superfamily enzyme